MALDRRCFKAGWHSRSPNGTIVCDLFLVWLFRWRHNFIISKILLVKNSSNCVRFSGVTTLEL